MKTGVKGLELIKLFEGLSLKAYKCPSDIWTIGYGNTYIWLYKVKVPVIQGMELPSEEEAESLLFYSLQEFEQAVNSLVKVELNQNQFDSLTSFCYNTGIVAFKNSTLLKVLNKGDYTGVGLQMDRWTKGNDGQPLPGLVRRRKAEIKLFYS